MLVARGGMAEVYRATDSVLGRPVAVKLLAARYARDREVRARFEREGRAAARLSGAANVITVFDVGEHEGRPLIVMEYLDGGSLYERIVGDPVTREQALDWLEQAARALDNAHAHGVVHRDVKPANLLLDREGSIQVSDFGIASASGLDSVTLPGTVLGTAGYLSPEQARGEPATAASDRYALAVIAFELLTGRRPFASDTPITEAFAHLNAPVPSATTFAPELPPGVDGVLARALSKDPDERPRSCAELVAELRNVLDPDEAPAPTIVDAGGPTRRMYSRPRGRREPLRYAVGVAGLFVAGLVVASLAGVGRDGASLESTQAREPAAVSKTVETSTPSPDGAALNDAGFARMQAGDYEGALPLLREAVIALRGSGSRVEAWASYNLAFTRFALGRCDGVLGLLERSERIQGALEPIDRLRSKWEAACGELGEDGGGGNWKGKGRGRGKGNED
ncbi:MAG: serine/threonine-protein kinase [Gaiellaceae bacterium]